MMPSRQSFVSGGDTSALWRRALRQRIMGQIYQLRDFPELGRRTLRSPYDDRRELIASPYRIPYRVVGDIVIILNIVDTRYPFPDHEEEATEP